MDEPKVPVPGGPEDEANRQRAVNEADTNNLKKENARLRSQMDQVDVALKYRAERIEKLKKELRGGCQGCRRVNEDYCRIRDLLRRAKGWISIDRSTLREDQRVEFEQLVKELQKEFPQ